MSLRIHSSFAVSVVTLIGCVADLADTDPAGAAIGTDATASTTRRSWKVTFQDEFEGPSLSKKWRTRYRWGAQTLPEHNEEQCYRKRNVSLHQGKLVLKAERRSVWCQGTRYDYASGMVSAHETMSQRYGYFEMRAKLPKGQGYWPAFWSLPNQPTRRAEIDVMEYLGHQPDRVYMNVHWENPQGLNQGLSTVYRERWKKNYHRRFHTFAVRWRSDSIDWYVDGIRRKRFTTADVPASYIPDEPMYLIANLAVGGNWPGAPDHTTPHPAEMEIDYIRAAQPIAGANPGLTANTGFEHGLNRWTPHGDTAVVGSPVRFGAKSARLRGQAGFKQTVSGLAPYTVYELSGYLRNVSGGAVQIGVSTYGGGAQMTHSQSQNAWGYRSLIFMTGDTSSVTVFVYQASGTSYVDNVRLRVAT